MRRLLLALSLAAALAASTGPASAQSPLVVTVRTDRTAYEPGAPVTLTVIASNPTNAPVTLNFSTGQIYDAIISAAPGGAEVWRWSGGRFFTQALANRTVAPGESLTFTETWNQRTMADTLVAPGVYTVEGVVTARPRLPSAPVTFVIGDARPLSGPGCTMVTATLPAGTPVTVVAGTVESREALRGIWKRDGDRWLGWSPEAAGPNDLREVNPRDELRLCLAGPTRWFVPA